MNDLPARRRVRRITALFMLTYFVSYVTRVNYGAVIAEMVSATGFSKAALSAALTGSFITYGVGQVVSGLFGDRFSPKKIVAAGIFLSACMNLLLPFLSSPGAYTVVWCVNGFAQALLWPPIVRLMTEHFDAATYKKHSVYVTYGSSLGTVAVYLISPLLISAMDFRLVFFVSGGVGMLMLPVWLIFAPDRTKNPAEAPFGASPAEVPSKTAGLPADGADPGRKGLFALLVSPLMIAVMAVIALQGMLRDGVTTWMPSLVAENFDVGNRIAILSGVVLPIFGIASLEITSIVYRKKLKNPLVCAGVIFGVGTAAALALIFAAGRSVILTVFFTALLIAAMHGVNLIVTCMIPPFFKKYGRVSTVSGLLNACTYVGSAVSTYAIAVLSDAFSWTVTLTVWLIIAAMGTALCLLCVRPWNKRITRGEISDV